MEIIKVSSEKVNQSFHDAIKHFDDVGFGKMSLRDVRKFLFHRNGDYKESISNFKKTILAIIESIDLDYETSLELIGFDVDKFMIVVLVEDARKGKGVVEELLFRLQSIGVCATRALF